MALLAISLTSAWLVGAVNNGNAQNLNFASEDTSQSPLPQDPAAELDQPPGQAPAGEAPAEPEGDGAAEQTEHGPLTAQDKEIVTKIHLAALWQRPAAADASSRAGDPKVKDAATKIAAEQATVSTQAKKVAGQLAMELPTEPGAEQRGWLAELSEASGEEYDKLFVDRLRTAQGSLLPLIGQARADTQNDLVRSLAQSTSTTVLRNMTFLERTGLVGSGSLESPDNGGGGNPNAPPPQNPPAQGGDTGAPDGNVEDETGLDPGDALDDGAADGTDGGLDAPPQPGAPDPSTPTNPGASAPTDPLDLPQGNPADNQAGGVATTPTSSTLGGADGVGRYVIFAMLAIAGLIFLFALRGVFRPR